MLPGVSWDPATNDLAGALAARFRLGAARQPCILIPRACGRGVDLVPGATIPNQMFSEFIAALPPPEAAVVYRQAGFTPDEGFVTTWEVDFTAVQASEHRNYGQGVVGSVEDTLAALWPEYWSAKEGDVDTFRALLGCYNLPETWEETGSVALHYGRGAPDFVHVNALRLIQTYRGDVEYDINRLVEGDYSFGFEDFLYDALRGKKAEQRDGTRCKVTVNYRSADDRFEGSYWYLCHNGGEEDDARKCWLYFNPDAKGEGRPWDAETLHWVEGGNCYTGNESRSGCHPPVTDTTNVGIGGWAGVTLHPLRLMFAGSTVDELLFRARLALDYANALKATDVVESLVVRAEAIKFARYALRIIVDHAELIIHELGHTWRSDAHCALQCFEDVCANHFVCKVRGRLGLPLEVWEPEEEWGDWNTERYAAFYREEEECDSNWSVWSCDVGTTGLAGSEAEYCSTGCVELPDATVDAACDDAPPEPATGEIVYPGEEVDEEGEEGAQGPVAHAGSGCLGGCGPATGARAEG
jgi:hypothetical protein